MADFLSQDEVDALLKGVTSEVEEMEESETEKAMRERYQAEILYYKNMIDTLLGLPRMDLVMDQFGRFLRKSIQEHYGISAQAFVGPTRLGEYKDFLRNIVVPSCLVPLKESKVHLNGLLALDPNFLFLLSDHLYGGDGRFHSRIAGRDLTSIEKEIIQDVSQIILGTYQSSAKQITGQELNFTFDKIETATQFLPISYDDTVLFTTITVEFSGCTMDIHFCFPLEWFTQNTWLKKQQHNSIQSVELPKIDIPEVETSHLLKLLEDLDIPQLSFITREHPQVSAFLLSHLDIQKVSQLLAKLSPRRRTDIILRMATRNEENDFSQENDILLRAYYYAIEGIKKMSKDKSKVSGENFGGVEKTVQYILGLPQKQQEEAIEAIREYDLDLAQSIQLKMPGSQEIEALVSQSVTTPPKTPRKRK